MKVSIFMPKYLKVTHLNLIYYFEHHIFILFTNNEEKYKDNENNNDKQYVIKFSKMYNRSRRIGVRTHIYVTGALVGACTHVNQNFSF